MFWNSNLFKHCFVFEFVFLRTAAIFDSTYSTYACCVNVEEIVWHCGFLTWSVPHENLGDIRARRTLHKNVYTHQCLAIWNRKFKQKKETPWLKGHTGCLTFWGTIYVLGEHIFKPGPLSVPCIHVHLYEHDFPRGYIILSSLLCGYERNHKTFSTKLSLSNRSVLAAFYIVLCTMYAAKPTRRPT